MGATVKWRQVLVSLHLPHKFVIGSLWQYPLHFRVSAYILNQLRLIILLIYTVPLNLMLTHLSMLMNPFLDTG